MKLQINLTPVKTIPPECDIVQLEEDIMQLQIHLGVDFLLNYGEITGGYVLVGDGNFDLIYVTFSNRPYLTSSQYYLVEMVYS